MKFICDVMLGRLARWLRLLGFATDYDDQAQDDQLLKEAARKQAVLITRDRRLAQKAHDYCHCVLVRPNDLHGQFREVVTVLGLKLPKTFSTAICPTCGHGLKRVPKASIKTEVWPRVYERQRAFWRCQNPACLRVYWKGTHTAPIQKVIQAFRKSMQKSIQTR